MGDKQYKTNNSYTDFFYHAFRNILIISIPLVIISALVLSLPHSSAEISSSSSDNVSFTLSTSCTIRGEVISAHTANLNGGQVVEDVGNTKLNAYCNDNNGYSIYAIGSSDDIDGNTDLISSINDNYNVHTGIYDSSTVSPSTPSSWAMKLTAGVGTNPNPTVPTIENSYNTYKEIPSIYTLVAKRTSKTDMDLDTTLSGSYINTTYQIYASSIQPAGTYSGKVKYVMVHPSSNNIHLGFNEVYALQGKNPVNTESGTYYTMQDMTTDICNQVGLYDEISQTQLVDIRDNKLYWVAKLQDGHCWMTQNLDFNIDTTRTYTHNDTDLGWDTNSFDANATWIPDTTNGKYNLPITGTSVSNWSNQANYPYSADPGDVYYYTSNSTSDDIKYTSLSNCTSAGHTEGECKHYHAGNYYNWTAAIASNNSSSLTTQYTNAPNSICPAGWRLPIATNADQSVYEFGKLLFEQGITTQRVGNPAGYASNGFNNIRKSPLWFVRSGGISGTSLLVSAANGLYWSSIVNGDSAYYLEFNGQNTWPTNSTSRVVGWSVRCLAR